MSNADVDTVLLSKIRNNTTFQPNHNYSINAIKQLYGDNVELSHRSKLVDGRNDNLNITTFETLWLVGADETYATTNVIDTVSSSSASDTNEIFIEGFTVVGTGASAVFTRVEQTATLNGVNKVSLDTSLARASFFYNNNTADWVGDIYCYENTDITAGVPIDLTKVHLKSLGAINQSEKAADTIGGTEYGLIVQTHGGTGVKKDGSASFFLQIREPGKVFRSIHSFFSNGNTVYNTLPVPLIVKPNSDIRIIAKTNVATLSAEGGLVLLFADIL